MRVRVTLLMRSLLLLLAVLLVGCTTTYTPAFYAPGVHVVPLFETAGEATIGGHIETPGVDGQVAWSPLPHVYLCGAGSLYGDRDDSAGAHVWHRWWGGGLGVYHAVPDLFTLEVSGGLGAGSAAASGYAIEDCATCPDRIRETGSYQRGDYEVYWGQLALGVAIHSLSTERKDGLYMLAAARLSSADVPELFEATWSSGSTDSAASSESRTLSTRGVFADWIIGLRLKAEAFTGDIRIGSAWRTNESPIDVVGIHYSLGAAVRLDRLLR